MAKVTKSEKRPHKIQRLKKFLGVDDDDDDGSYKLVSMLVS